ncbi:EamA family transporter, partial [Faecalibacillus faecis]|nr:EamA family transporter [Faecalibacillus faecis]
GRRFFLGFLLAMCGICLISFGGTALQLSPKGDFLAVLAAFVWAAYSMLTKKIGSFGHNIIQSTRRCFAWGLLFMAPVLLFTDISL